MKIICDTSYFPSGKADKPESVLENKTNKILWDFEIQTDNSIPDRRSELMLINRTKKSRHLVDFAVPDNKGKKRGRYLDLTREIKKWWIVEL